MKTQFLLVTAAALLMSACGKPAKSDGVAPAKPTETASPDTAPPLSSGGFSKAFMIGKWAEEKDGDCTLAQEFKADGTVDGVFDSWKVNGTFLIVTMMDKKTDYAVTVVDPKHIDVQADGKKSRLIRCS